MLRAWNPDAVFEIIDGADHFYGGYADELESMVSSYL
jgi:alpha/beta superfamily hydrolase